MSSCGRRDGAEMAARWGLERQQPGVSCGRALHRRRARHSHSPLGWFGCHFHHLRTLKCHVGLCWGHLGVVLGSFGGFLEATVSILRLTGAVSVHFELLWGRLCHPLIFWVNCGALWIHSEWFWGHSHVFGAIPGLSVSVWADISHLPGSL